MLLDLGADAVRPLARFAVERADQVVVVTTPEWLASSVVRNAVSGWKDRRATVAMNKSYLRSRDVRAVEERFRAERQWDVVGIPDDERLARALHSGTYAVEALGGASRAAIKRLGFAVSERLV